MGCSNAVVTRLARLPAQLANFARKTAYARCQVATGHAADRPLTGNKVATWPYRLYQGGTYRRFFRRLATRLPLPSDPFDACPNPWQQAATIIRGIAREQGDADTAREVGCLPVGGNKVATSSEPCGIPEIAGNQVATRSTQ